MKLTLKGLVKICFSVWALAIVAFALLVISNQGNTTYTTEQSNLMIGIVLTGFFSFGLGFLFIIVDYLFAGKDKKKHEKSKEHEITNVQRAPIQNGLILIIVILVVVIAYLLGSNNSFFLNSNKLITPTIALPPPTSLPTDVPVQQTKQYVPPANTNTDQPVHCNVHPNCGGGTTPLKKRECDNSICCQVNGKWVFYKDKYQCGVDQGKSVNTSSNVNTNTTSTNRVPVFISSGGYTLQCPSQNVAAINSINATIENKRTQWATNYNNCTSTFWNTDSCYLACKEGEISAYGECIKSCPSAYEACKWTNSERENLVKQMSDLCK